MYIELSGGFGKVQVIFKEGPDDIEGFVVNRFQGFFSEDLTYKHVADLSGQLIDQTANAQTVVTENVFVSIKDLADLQSSAGFLVGIGKLHDIICNIAVGNPGRGHGLCIEHIHQHAGDTIQLFVAFGALKLTYYDNAGIIQCSDKIPCTGRKDVADSSQGIFVLMLLGLYKKYRTAGRRCDMKPGCLVKGFYLGIAFQEKVLHKGVLVCFFRIGGEETFYLANSKLSDGRSLLSGAPYDQKHITLRCVVQLVQTAAAVGDT